MDERTYQRELRKARLQRDGGKQADYWLGYERGLIRGYRGKRFFSDREHELWLSIGGMDEPALRERGRGYRDGLVMATAEEAA